MRRELSSPNLVAVIHMIPEKTVHQRIALKPPDPNPAVPSSQITGLAADQGSTQLAGSERSSELSGDTTYGANINVKNAHLFHRELESTIHKQQVSGKALPVVHPGCLLPQFICRLEHAERGGRTGNISPRCSMRRFVMRVEITFDAP